VNFLNRLIIWFMSRMAKNQIGRFDFGVVYFGSHKAPIVAYKHPHIGEPKLFYVDALALNRLAGKENDDIST
jgi:hypothetical protein